jgi:hypothetical protein
MYLYIFQFFNSCDFHCIIITIKKNTEENKVFIANENIGDNLLIERIDIIGKKAQKIDWLIKYISPFLCSDKFVIIMILCFYFKQCNNFNLSFSNKSKFPLLQSYKFIRLLHLFPLMLL